MRTKFIQDVIDKIGAKSYLEIGTQHGYNFEKIICDNKVGVDPGDYVGDHIQMTSDEYFDTCTDVFDVIFIDGLHHADQVITDFNNALCNISVNGVIILHDCNPKTKREQVIPEEHLPGWTGNVWRAWINIRRYKEFTTVCVDICTGMGLVIQRPVKKALDISFDDTLEMTYEDMDKDRKRLLNLRDDNYFKNILKTLIKI